MDERAQNYLNQYLETLSDSKRRRYTSFASDHFCADEYNANTCADLVLRGIKTATCSMKYWYQEGGEPMPQVGRLEVVTDWDKNPVCIIEVTAVEQCRFSEVTAEFARAEGEGDCSLAWWRQAHWNFFSRECAELKREPSEDMVLILERFHVVYPSTT